MPAVIRNPGYGYPYQRAFGTLMFQSMWIVYHVCRRHDNNAERDRYRMVG